jgi:ferredoxin
MQANFGYKDGSGDFFITLDTTRCTGCGDCVPACPARIWELAENEYDPLAEGQIAVVKRRNLKSIKYDCGPCKPASGPTGPGLPTGAPLGTRTPSGRMPFGHGRSLPCVNACRPRAISHSW